MQPTPRFHRRRFLLAAAMAGLVPGRGLQAAFDGALAADGWQEMTFRDKPGNRYRLDGDGTVVIESRASVSVAWRDLSADLARTPILRWRWRVDRAVPPTDLTRKGGDDRSLSVYVAFAWVPERASLLERSVRAVLSSLAGQELPGRLLTYVWGGDGRANGWFDNPYLPTGAKLRVLRDGSAPLGAWLEERVDVRADFRAAFGEEPPAVERIGIGADSDDTGSEARGAIRDLGWLQA
ncbi:MAG: DUF3047 domain-containing protein [Geminicoccaceae bacterium]|nr:DUF3047 domain-containing protein [Geminicoccaceae bacterium]MCX8102220.1 DUF3047 domain-containing protein [Geminicoccaceae bacterium]MDW8370694.1 DUF3047 domain-containing protein [Geminicoccaceae bacterium]